MRGFEHTSLTGLLHFNRQRWFVLHYLITSLLGVVSASGAEQSGIPIGGYAYLKSPNDYAVIYSSSTANTQQTKLRRDSVVRVIGDNGRSRNAFPRGRYEIEWCLPPGSDCYTGWVDKTIAVAWQSPLDMTPRPKADPACKGYIETSRYGLNLRSRPTTNEAPICTMGQDSDFCVTSSNYQPGKRSWLEVSIDQDSLDSLSPYCQQQIKMRLKPMRDGKFLAYLYNLPTFINDVDPKQALEARGICSDCSEPALARLVSATTAILDTAQEVGSRALDTATGWILPLADSVLVRVSSGFGRRTQPLPGASSYHQSVDLTTGGVVGAGAPVRAPMTGRVTSKGWGCSSSGSSKRKRLCNGKAGNYLVIEHINPKTGKYDGLYTSKYMHLHEECPWSVKEGDIVQQGQNFACVGNSGNSTGPHLDFSTTMNGKRVPPSEVFGDQQWSSLLTTAVSDRVSLILEQILTWFGSYS